MAPFKRRAEGVISMSCSLVPGSTSSPVQPPAWRCSTLDVSTAGHSNPSKTASPTIRHPQNCLNARK